MLLQPWLQLLRKIDVKRFSGRNPVVYFNVPLLHQAGCAIYTGLVCWRNRRPISCEVSIIVRFSIKNYYCLLSELKRWL